MEILPYKTPINLDQLMTFVVCQLRKRGKDRAILLMFLFFSLEGVFFENDG